MQDYAYLLAIDTCGPTGSVALGQQVDGELRILGETQFDGRRGSDSLVSSVSELLSMAEVQLPKLSAIVAVNGPGSFTGVRVGLAAVKGLAESARIPVVALSRLEVLAHKAGIPSAALDAHRQEIYLRIAESGAPARELLAGAQELAAIQPAPPRIAVCDDDAAAQLAATWPSTELVRTLAPTAADALTFGAARVDAGVFVDLALLDGHYLRRSDAEIFGEPDAGPRRA
jgi:tRNA threonylcarbamoyladenosine biosynthesis protein TsaB